MLVNRHNLEIARHCAKKPYKDGRRFDQLWLTKTGTMAFAGHSEKIVYSIEVGALSVPPSEDTGYIETAEAISRMQAPGEKHTIKPNVSKQVPIPTQKDLPASFEINLDAHHLKAIVDSLHSLDPDGVVKISFPPVKEGPIKLENRNLQTGQLMTARLMARIPGNLEDEKRFAAGKDWTENIPKGLPVEQLVQSVIDADAAMAAAIEAAMRLA